jgi:DNA-binding NtrC family response regulator
VVDDDPNVLSAVTRSLRRLPVKVKCVASAEEAIASMMREKPTLIISDYALPGLDGLSLLEEAKAQNPSLQCVLHTGKSAIASRYGLDIPVLAKPCEPSALQDLVASLFQIESPPSEGGVDIH